MKQYIMRLFIAGILVVAGTAALAAREAGGAWAGISLGTPGFVNGNMAFYGTRFGFRGSLCFLNIIEFMDDEEEPAYDDEEEPWMFASQLNFDLVLFSRDSVVFTAGLVGGFFYAAEQYAEEDVFCLYGGLALGAIIGGFYIELGCAYLSNYDASIYGYDNRWVPLVQVGYMFRFK